MKNPLGNVLRSDAHLSEDIIHFIAYKNGYIRVQNHLKEVTLNIKTHLIIDSVGEEGDELRPGALYTQRQGYGRQLLDGIQP